MKRILFYEFSDLNREPLPFHTLADFKKFCNMYGIIYNLNGNMELSFNNLSQTSSIKATCLKGTKLLVFWSAYSHRPEESDSLIREYENFKKFAESNIRIQNTTYSKYPTSSRIMCGDGTNRFYLMIWESEDKTDKYLYLNASDTYTYDGDCKVESEDDEIYKNIIEFRDTIKKEIETNENNK